MTFFCRGRYGTALPATSSFVLHSPGTLHSMPRKLLYSWLDWKWAERQTKETMNDPQTKSGSLEAQYKERRWRAEGHTTRCSMSSPFWSIWFMNKAFLKLCGMSLCVWDLRNASCMLMLVMEHEFPNPSVKLSLILSQTAKCMQWNFHQNPSISSKSQRNLQLLNSCSPWRWALALGPLSERVLVFWAIHTRRTDIGALHSPLRQEGDLPSHTMGNDELSTELRLPWRIRWLLILCRENCPLSLISPIR